MNCISLFATATLAFVAAVLAPGTVDAADEHWLESADVVISLACGFVGSEPAVRVTLTNNGTSDEGSSLMIPIPDLVHLRVTNKFGERVPIDANYGGDDEGKMIIPGLYKIKVHHSVDLNDHYTHSEVGSLGPKRKLMPLRRFGYTLAPGTYTIRGFLVSHNPSIPDGPESQPCTIEVPQ